MKFSLTKPQVGNDPEMFIMKEGSLVPSESFLNKHEKIKVDNAAVELQPGPNHCLQFQNEAIANLLETVKQNLDEKGMSNAKISLRPTEELSRDDITTYRSVCLFGCQPSLVFDGMHLRVSAPSADPKKVKHRSVGFHVHLGSMHPNDWKKSQTLEYQNTLNGKNYLAMANLLHTTEGRVRLVQLCDLFVALPAVLIERDYRVSTRRKLLGYGQAGEFREQPHGFEYRTLGSWPLIHPMWSWWANASVRDCLYFVENDLDKELMKGIDMQKVAEIINSGNLEGALDWWGRAKYNLHCVIDEINTDEDLAVVNDSNPLMSKRTLKMFDFLAAKRDLANLTFDFETWYKKVEYPSLGSLLRTFALTCGFPTGAKARIKGNPDWIEFDKEWSLDKDIISKQLLA